MDANQITYQKALNGYYKVFVGARFYGTVKKADKNWSFQPRNGNDGKPLLKGGKTSTTACHLNRDHAAGMMILLVNKELYNKGLTPTH